MTKHENLNQVVEIFCCLLMKGVTRMKHLVVIV
jgi:hypothetical protein